MEEEKNFLDLVLENEKMEETKNKVEKVSFLDLVMAQYAPNSPKMVL